MHTKNPTIRKLLESYKQISTLSKIKAVLDWDLNVNLPPKASTGRARQTAYLAELQVKLWTDPEFKKLLEQAKRVKGLTKEEKAVLRNLEYAGKYYFRVPREIIIEKDKTTSEAFMVWQQAKKTNKFKDFLPYLKKIIHLDQIIASHLGFKENPYDALLDLFEPELTVSACSDLFGKIQPELTTLLKKIQKSSSYIEKSDLVEAEISYPILDQKQLAMFVMRKMGYDFEAGRMDVSSHPFTNTLDRYDIRLTTWYHENDFRSSFAAAMHETGHALYEQSINPEFSETPLEGGVSLGIHEALSRFWENNIGRSIQLLTFLTPIFQAFYPNQFSKTGSETLVKLFNLVKPSFIRVEADEVTYSLHIIIRFELENDLINNKLKAEDLPEAWRAKMKKYLGIEPKGDREGVLQDVHWSLGYFGYFPAYALGNLYNSQFMASLQKELNVDELLIKGELGTITAWLNEHIHQYGSLYWPAQLIKIVTGKPLDPKYFTQYINNKYAQIYNLK